MEKTLKELYTNISKSHPSIFAGAQTLYLEAKKLFPTITKKQVEEFLQGENAYTLHKARRIHFKRSKTVPAGLWTHAQVDLGDFQKFSKYNKGFRYLLVLVDVLSRQVFTAPIKSKKALDVKRAFLEIFPKLPQIPLKIHSDQGKEFCNKELKEFFDENNIIKTESRASVMKAAVAERMILTIKK